MDFYKVIFSVSCAAFKKANCYTPTMRLFNRYFTSDNNGFYRIVMLNATDSADAKAAAMRSICDSNAALKRAVKKYCDVDCVPMGGINI